MRNQFISMPKITFQNLTFP